MDTQGRYSTSGLARQRLNILVLVDILVNILVKAPIAINGGWALILGIVQSCRGTLGHDRSHRLLLTDMLVLA